MNAGADAADDAAPRTLLILFHPDYDRRLRNSTGSADPSHLEWEGARGLKLALLPPVGNCTPPWEWSMR